tara:strand:- start:992 stop:2176 length:1185 start_codon:yes stop_codon:yes gene_type:complete
MLVRNDKKEHAKILEKMFNGAQEVYITVAFLKYSGLKVIKDIIEDTLKNNGNVNFIVGLDLYVTEPNALYELLDLCQKKYRLEFYLFNSKSSTFHPKMYASKGSKKSSVLIGSANLTNGGLSSNVEASIYSENDDLLFEECKKFFSDLIQNSNCKKASALDIREYELQYTVFKKELSKAKRSSKDKISKLAETTLLKECYKEYCNNKEQMKSLDIKRTNYEEARLLVHKLNTDSIKSKSDFMRVYEKLVGAAGQEKRWHSGGIFRSKNKVADSYREFLKFTSFASNEDILNQTPKIIFDKVMPFKEKIAGLGFNVITELLNTLKPMKFPVLNKNPLGSVKYLLGKDFKEPSQFKSDDYQAYADLMDELCTNIGAKDLIEMDHFLNFVYWKYARN